MLKPQDLPSTPSTTSIEAEIFVQTGLSFLGFLVLAILLF